MPANAMLAEVQTKTPVPLNELPLNVVLGSVSVIFWFVALPIKMPAPALAVPL